MGFMEALKGGRKDYHFDISVLSVEENEELNKNINAIIEKYKGNRQAVNRLVFESVAAMTAGEAYERELSNRHGLKRFVGSLTGSNKALQDKVNHNRSVAQYASQQTLQRLAEQNAMSFDLIAAVNNKLNASVAAIEGEFVQVYDYLIRFFKQTRSDMIQLESRVERLERNVNLLNWQNAIEYQVFNGVEYSELDDAAKIVCLARDFFEITKGDWTTSDLLLLKVAMNTIQLSPQETGNYFDFIKRLSYDLELKNKLLGRKQLVRQPDADYLTMLGGIKKLELLGTTEHYVVAAVAEQIDQTVDEETISENLTKSYLTQTAQINVNFAVSYYDLILELIYSLRQATEEGLIGDETNDESNDESEVLLAEKFKKASELFRTYNPEEVLPLLIELSEAGYGEANALLYWLYIDGYYENQQYKGSTKIAKEYLKKGYEAQDIVSTLLYATINADIEAIAENFIPKAKALADDGDIYAEYVLGIVDLNEICGGCNYLSAMEHFMHANREGFYRAAGSIFLRYYRGNEEPFKKDWLQCLLWAKEVMNYRFPDRLFNVAYMYMNIEDYGVTDKDLQNIIYEGALPIWEYLTDIGNTAAPTNLGWMYESGKGTPVDLNKAFHYYTIAAERGDDVGECNLASLYEYGRGTAVDKNKAIQWYRKAAEQGLQRAKDALNRLGCTFWSVK